MSARVSLEREGSLAIVTLSHPAKFNAMSRPMWQQLRAHFEALQAQPEVRVVLVRGEGAHFCAGGDIAEYEGFRFETESLRAFHEDEVWGGLSAMLECDIPLLAQIEGNCMGAGLEIASCCDLRLAAGSARFGAPIAKLGFPMAPREAALVAGVVGDATAREMLLAAQVLDAPTMASRGFLHRVCADRELPAACSELAQSIARLAPQAARMNKRTLRQLGREGHAALPDLVRRAYDYADSAEHREGIAAFMAKRPPNFS
jgi:enoyl-CoA hydratase/carnithine racemase